MKPSEMTEEQLRHALSRCDARLSGVMPMGYMTPNLVRGARAQYQHELSRRKQTELEFK